MSNITFFLYLPFVYMLNLDFCVVKFATGLCCVRQCHTSINDDGGFDANTCNVLLRLYQYGQSGQVSQIGQKSQIGHKGQIMQVHKSQAEHRGQIWKGAHDLN